MIQSELCTSGVTWRENAISFPCGDQSNVQQLAWIVGERIRFRPVPLTLTTDCHCSRCRKHSGAFGGTQGRVPREGFRLLAGEKLIRVFKPDDGRVKAFCSVCGSSLFGADWPEGDEVAIRLGSLDGDPGIRPEFHAFVASRAPWDEIPDDGLPRYDEGYLEP
jgi:hypothetical protein